MKKLISTLTIVFVVLTACSNYGEKLEYNGTEVYYKNGVTIEQAEQLTQYLSKQGFTDGNRKSVQLMINEDTGNLTFRMVTSKGAAYNPENDAMFEAFTRNLSEEFKQPVDFHLCDESFETLRSFNAADIDNLITKGNLQVLYTNNVTQKQAQDLANFLNKDEDDTTAMTVQLDQRNDTLVYKMVVKPGFENNASYGQILKTYGEMMSKEIFNNQTVEVHMCDNNLQTLKVL